MKTMVPPLFEVLKEKEDKTEQNTEEEESESE